LGKGRCKVPEYLRECCHWNTLQCSFGRLLRQVKEGVFCAMVDGVPILRCEVKGRCKVPDEKLCDCVRLCCEVKGRCKVPDEKLCDCYGHLLPSHGGLSFSLKKLPG